MSDRKEQLPIVLKALRQHDANNTCMTVEECATGFGIHRDTVIRRLQSGKWKGHLVGRVWRIPKLQFLKEIIEKE